MRRFPTTPRSLSFCANPSTLKLRDSRIARSAAPNRSASTVDLCVELPFLGTTLLRTGQFVVEYVDKYLELCYKCGVKSIPKPLPRRTRMRTTIKPEALQSVLAKRGISQRQLAGMMKIGEASVSRMVNGQHTPGPELRTRLLSVLSLGFDDLFEIVSDHRQAVSR